MNTFIVSIWVAFGIATVTLAVYRTILSAHQERDVLHLAENAQGEVAKQFSLASRLSAIDRWGKTLTVVTVLVGLGLATSYLYQAWESQNPGPNNFYGINSPAR